MYISSLGITDEVGQINVIGAGLLALRPSPPCGLPPRRGMRELDISPSQCLSLVRSNPRRVPIPLTIYPPLLLLGLRPHT